VKQKWRGDTLSFKVTAAGKSCAGEIRVCDRYVQYQVSLPWSVSFFAGRIKRMIEESGRKVLAAG
jgi:hypothetical protein